MGACSTHQAAIHDRNGSLILNADVLLEVGYTRVLDDVSTANIRFAPDGDCCQQAGNIRAWRHFLRIYRDGDIVWTGPIVNVSWKFGEVRVAAVDIIGLLDRRVPHQNLAFSSTDLSDIAAALIEDGFAPDDPGHEVTMPAGSSMVVGTRTYLKDVGQTGDHLRDLADTGLDFTAVGTNIVLLPETFCGVVGRLSDEDMPDGLTVTEDGASLATRQVVAGSDASGAIGSAGGADAYYGLIEKYVQESSLTTNTDAATTAAARLRSTAAVPVFVDTREVTLGSETNLDVSMLVPGWCLDVTSTVTCRDIIQRLKITGLQVTEDGGTAGSPGQEKITVQVATAGSEST